MAKELDIEKIYEFIERFDFEELSENNKSFVLKHITNKEYNDIRSTINDTMDLFSKYPKSVKKEKIISFKKIVTYPVEFYKIVAAVLLIICIGFIISKVKTSDQQELLATIDTVFVEKKDIIVIEKTDTVKMIKEKIVYKDLPQKQNLISFNNEVLETVNYKRDCSRDICPDDIRLLSKIKTKGDFSNDSSLTDFIVSMN